MQTGSGVGKRAGSKSDPVCRRSNHARAEDQAGRRKRANIDVVGGWQVHTADETPSRNAATRSKHCNFKPYPRLILGRAGRFVVVQKVATQILSPRSNSAT